MQAGFVSLGMLYPSLMLDIRYATSHNLTGEPLDGYLASKALATQEAAQALGQALRIFDRHGYGLCIYEPLFALESNPGEWPDQGGVLS